MRGGHVWEKHDRPARAGLRRTTQMPAFRQFMYDGSIASITPNVCQMFGVDKPALAEERAVNAVIQYANGELANGSLERCLVYCPDALGDQIWSKSTEHVEAITACAPRQIHVSSVVPPVTPVCFASVFSGAPPERHGIRKYERPTLTCDTLFDALLRAGKRIAIVAVRDSSIDLLFRDRRLDYFSETYDREATERALSVIDDNTHHLVVVYHQEYDDLLHQTHPHSDVCMQAVAHHVQSFEVLTRAAHKAWAAHNHAIIFAPDHGAHTDPATGHGDHGLDIPEDMSLRHWYGVWAATN